MLHKQEALLFSVKEMCEIRNDQYVVVYLELCLLFSYYKMLTVCLKALVRCHEASWILCQKANIKVFDKSETCQLSPSNKCKSEK